jgi:hypothetical protein
MHTKALVIYTFALLTVTNLAFGMDKLTSSGNINFMQANSPAKTKNIPFTLNNVSGTLKLYYNRNNKNDIIRGEFIVNNSASKKSHIHYRIVFKDKVGAVAQSKGDIIVGRTKNQKVKFGSVILTKEDMKNINSYDIKMNML